MNKVCIAQADSGVESENYHSENGYYSEPQDLYRGITDFGHALINHTLTKTDKAKWAIENAEVNPHSKQRYWVRRLENTEHWIIYDIYVNLNDVNFLIWKLKDVRS